MNTERAKNILIKVLFAVVIGLAVYLLFAHCIPLLMPFLLALLVGTCVRPLAKLLHRKLRIPIKLSSVVLVTIVLALVVFLLLWLSSEVISYLRTLINRYNDRIVPFFNDMSATVSKTLSEWDPDLAEFFVGMQSSLLSTVGAKIAELSGPVVTATIGSVPRTLLQVLFFIASSYFIALDFDLLDRSLKRYIRPGRYEKIAAMRKTFGKTIVKMLRSYGIIFLCTFAELTLGLLLLGVPNFIVLALGIAAVDILPVVGSGTVLLPWGAFELLRGNTGIGIGLLALYACIAVIRQLLEPRIVGKQTGLHPLVTLISMYVGLRLFGGLGMLGLPVLMAVLAALQREGVIKFKNYSVPDDGKIAQDKAQTAQDVVEIVQNGEEAAQDIEE